MADQKNFDVLREPREFELYVRQFADGAFTGRHLMVVGRDSIGKTTIVRKILPNAPVINGDPSRYGILKEVFRLRHEPFVIFDDLHPSIDLLRSLFKNLFDK